MVGHRVSQAELYDDRDVIIQILKLKDTVNDYAGGIIDSIDVVGNDLVIDWADGTNISLPLPPPTGISSVAGTVSGGNLTITFYMSDGSSHAFTCPLNGMASESYVDTKDAQNVKLTGAQSIADVKTFTDSPVVPTVPTPLGAVNSVYVDDPTEGVNNILHKSGVEVFTEIKYGKLNAKQLNNGPSATGWLDVLTFNLSENLESIFLQVRESSVDNVEYNIQIYRGGATDMRVFADILSKSATYTPADVMVALDNNDNKWHLFIYKRQTWRNLFVEDMYRELRGTPSSAYNKITFLEPTAVVSAPSSPDYDYIFTGTAKSTYFNGSAI